MLPKNYSDPTEIVATASFRISYFPPLAPIFPSKTFF